MRLETSLIFMTFMIAQASVTDDCKIVLNAYQAMGGSTTGVTDCCTWNGVSCSTMGVRTINWSGKGLTGRIPDSIGYLSELQYLGLTSNSLSGSIPDTFRGLAQLSMMTLQENKLQGIIPSWIGSLKNLKILNLGNNSLTGTIPPTIGNMDSLERL